MERVKLVQGTLQWEKARETRIGSSEIFDIVRYYAEPYELQNCGISHEKIMDEAPYTSAWALYHKMRGDGLFQRETLAPEYAEYGHAVEPYGVYVLNKGRSRKVKPGMVYLDKRLIASLDVSGTSEQCDCVPYTVGSGSVMPGKRFVCEQKSMHPARYKQGLPLKYIVQAQYQAAMVQADFFIIQVMVLHNDTPFERGRITQMSLAQRKKYLADNMDVYNLYFRYNESLSALIATCINRFFADVDSGKEPTPFISSDKPKHIIASIRANTYFTRDSVVHYDLSDYVMAKENGDAAENARKAALQQIIETAKAFNSVKFTSPDGTSASFSVDGKFLVRPPKEGANAGI